MACECHECQLRRLRPATGSAGQQDGFRRIRLGDELPDAAQVVLDVLCQQIWFYPRCIQLLDRQPLILIDKIIDVLSLVPFGAGLKTYPPLLFTTSDTMDIVYDKLLRRGRNRNPDNGVSYLGHEQGYRLGMGTPILNAGMLLAALQRPEKSHSRQKPFGSANASKELRCRRTVTCQQ